MPPEYPITRKYTIPRLTTYFSIVSVVAIAALTVLNVILQGYDVVTVLRPDPNVTQSYWWSVGPLSLRSAGSCDPASLPRKLKFSTNSSLFSYELRSTFDANKRNIIGASSYMANPLSSCTADGIVVAIDLGRRTYTFDAPILCTGSDLPFSLSLVSRFSLSQYNPYYDDIMAYYIQNRHTREGLGVGLRLIQRNASSPDNIVGILDAVSSDLMAALWVLGNTSTEAIPTMISTGGFLACPRGQNTTCKPEDMRMTVPASLLSYPNRSEITTYGIGSFLAPAERPFLNMFTVLQDAYHIDVGNIQPHNTLLNRDAFSARIKPDSNLSRVARSERFCSWGLGCIYNSTWTDQLLAWNQDLSVTVPSILPAGSATAVVKFDYLCPEFRVKGPGRLITSVFIGTWTMYTALYGLFGFVGPSLERRYGRRHELDARDVRVPPGDHARVWGTPGVVGVEVCEVEDKSSEIKGLLSRPG